MLAFLVKFYLTKNVKTIIPYHAAINKFLPYAFRNPTSVNISRPSQEGALDLLTQLIGSLHLRFWALGPPLSQHLHRRVSLTKKQPNYSQYLRHSLYCHMSLKPLPRGKRFLFQISDGNFRSQIE